MTNFGTIYCFTCSVSNKKYIGQTWKQVVGTSGGGQTGIVHRSTRRKISNTLKGIPKPPRTREHCKKISMSKRGRKLSAEHKRKIGAALKGREIPLSQRIFLSKSRMGENNPMFGTIPWNKGMKTKVELEPSVVKHADLKDPE